MLFVDEIVLVSGSRGSPQKQLDVIKNYLENKNLVLNAKKSVALVLRNKREVNFNFRGAMLEVKDKFVYLGFKFSALRGM